MEYYVVKFDVVDHVYWNGLCHSFGNLGTFIATPIFSKLGKKIIGFKEIITDRIIVNRVNFYDTMESEDYFDYFSQYDWVHRKSGDVGVKVSKLAEIKTGNTIIEMDNKIREYLSQDKKRINEDIDKLKIKDIKRYRNKNGQELEKKDMSYYDTPIYIANPGNRLTLLVTPVYSKISKNKIVGFREIVSGNLIIKRFYDGESDAITDYLKRGNQIIDEVDTTKLATREMSVKEIENYMSQSEHYINMKMNECYNKKNRK